MAYELKLGDTKFSFKFKDPKQRMNQMETIKNENGFTLIEAVTVLVVCVIVIISGIVPNLFKEFINLFETPQHQAVKIVNNSKKEKMVEDRMKNLKEEPQEDLVQFKGNLQVESTQPESNEQEDTIPSFGKFNLGDIAVDEMKEASDKEQSIFKTEAADKGTKFSTKTQNHAKELYQTYLSIWDEMDKEPKKVETNGTRH